MKIYLALISAAALALTACSQEASQPEPTAPAAEASAPAASEVAETTAASETAPAASETAATESADVPAELNCEAVIESDDAMKYNTSEITVNKACKEFKLTLKHVGKMPKTAMGHNIVITDSSNVDGVVSDGAAAGVDANYVKAGDERVIAHTKLIGGGEEDAIIIDTSKFAAGNQYEFFCSFPGHIGLMRGQIKLVD